MDIRKKKKMRKLFIILTLILAVVGAIHYGLADRYLIEHVEVVVQDEETTSDSTVADDIQIKIDHLAIRLSVDLYIKKDIQIHSFQIHQLNPRV